MNVRLAIHLTDRSSECPWFLGQLLLVFKFRQCDRRKVN